MAYMDQTKKAAISAALKLVMPKGWKYTLAVHNHSSLRCLITKAPFDILSALTNKHALTDGYSEVNTYWVREATTDECLADTLQAIVAALNTGNHNRSDVMSDYYDVGHYISLNIGCYGKPFHYTPEPLKVSA